MTYFRIFAVVFFSFVSSILGESIIFKEQDPAINSGNFLYYKEDSSRAQSIESLIKLPESEFHKIKEKIPVFPASNADHWFKFTLVNPSSKKMVLQIANPLLQNIEVYSITSNSDITKENLENLQTGESFFYDLHLYKAAGPNPITYYIKINTYGSLILPVKLGTEDSILKLNHRIASFYLLLLGFLFCILLSNFVFFMILKDTIYIYHILFFSISILLNSIYMGVTKEFLYPYQNSLTRLLPAFISLQILVIYFLSRRFLHLKIYFPKLEKYLTYFFAAFIPVILINLLGYDEFSYRVADTFAIIGMLLLLTASIKTLIAGNRYARYVIFAWLSYIIGELIQLSLSLKIINPINFITLHSFMIGSFIQSVFLLMAIGDRIFRLKAEKEFSDANMIKTLIEKEQMQLNLNENLKIKVEERTKELEEQSDKINLMYFELLASEEELQENKKNMNLLVSSLDDQIFEIDFKGKFLNVWNDNSIAFGKKFEELRNHTFSELFPPDFANPFIQIIRTSLETREINNWEYSSLDNNKRIFNAKIVPIKTAPKSIKKVTMLITDITEKKIAELQLIKAQVLAEAADRAKSNFLATMSHEIRTPMNAVIGLTKLLLETELNQKQKKYIEIIQKSGENLLKIISDVLEFSRIESGKTVNDIKAFNLHNCIHSSIEMLQEIANEKELTLKKNISPSVPAVVIGDEIAINQILINLINNAIKFTDSGNVIVSVFLATETEISVNLKFTIQDTGIGISKAQLEKLFKAFTQMDSSRSRKYGGTGLGLAITKKLIEIQGGKIAVESLPGEGSIFSFTIPFKKAMSNSDVQPEKEIEIEFFEDIHVLICEDNEFNIIILEEVLNKWKCTFDVSETGVNALKKLSEKNYSIVLLDLHLPEMDGFEVIEAIRNGKNGIRQKNIPVIALTADAFEDTKERVLKLGMNDYLSKPVNFSLLNQKMKKLLKPKTG